MSENKEWPGFMRKMVDVLQEAGDIAFTSEENREKFLDELVENEGLKAMILGFMAVRYGEVKA